LHAVDTKSPLDGKHIGKAAASRSRASNIDSKLEIQMTNVGKWAFIAGLVLAVIVGLFIQGNIAPWLVACLGLIVGFLNVQASEARTFLLAGIALTVALISIQVQPYNPIWLTNVVLYVKVFITHALLVVGVMAFIKIAKD
jgi:hypothetical protein